MHSVVNSGGNEAFRPRSRLAARFAGRIGQLQIDRLPQGHEGLRIRQVSETVAYSL